MNWIIAYFVCLASFLVMDGVFIGLFAKKAYFEKLDGIINKKPKVLPGTILYIFYIGAVLLYGVWPLLHFFHREWNGEIVWKTLLWGGGLGLTTYGLYSLTAMSLVRGWKTSIASLDIIWGGVLTSVLVLIGYAIVH